jgi:cellulose synthase/poly-beta-1,6-N-acetylglucosamine synthase-like glycosyltransferase
MQNIFYLFLFFVSIQLLFYVLLFGRFSFAKTIVVKSSFPPISIIICARNEAENLRHNLPAFINQDYPNFELVLINDSSSDETLEIMESLLEKHTHNIKIVNVEENEKFWGNKKYALTLGIKSAKHEHLLFSDADCKPVSKQWIQEMSSQFSERKSIVLGYGSYDKIKNSFLNRLIRFETLMTAIQYFSYAKNRLPYMGVGRNLAYTKTLFFKTTGFTNHMHLKSGDDDLFINQNGNPQNIALQYTKNSFTTSVPKNSFKEWILQKRRHVTTATHYKPIHKFLLGLYYFSQLAFWSLAILLLSFTFLWEIVLGIVIFRIGIHYLVIAKSAQKLDEKDIVIWAPFLEVFLIFIQLFIFIKNLTSKPTHW